jgi:hypothetical protein
MSWTGVWIHMVFSPKYRKPYLNDRVGQYILNQEEHHSKKTFKEESERFMKKYGWTQLKD